MELHYYFSPSPSSSGSPHTFLQHGGEDVLLVRAGGQGDCGQHGGGGGAGGGVKRSMGQGAENRSATEGFKDLVLDRLQVRLADHQDRSVVGLQPHPRRRRGRLNPPM